MADEIRGVRVAVLLTDGVEEPEFVKPKEALEKAGAKVSVISPKGGEIRSRKPDDIPAFNREMLKLFAEGRSAARDRKIA
jgi:hypothetical protein